MSDFNNTSAGVAGATEDGFDKVTKVAAIVPVLAAIYLTYRGLQSLEMGQELVILGTAVMASLSWMLSQGVSRYLRIKGAPVMGCTVLVLSSGFGAAEAAFAHVGIAFMLEAGALHVHDGVIWFFSVLLTVTNFFAKWAFLGKPDVKDEPAASRQAIQPKGANVVKFDPNDERTLAKVAERFRAAQ